MKKNKDLNEHASAGKRGLYPTLEPLPPFEEAPKTAPFYTADAGWTPAGITEQSRRAEKAKEYPAGAMRLAEMLTPHARLIKTWAGIINDEVSPLVSALRALHAEIARYHIGHEGSELLEVMSDANAALARWEIE